jgi:hypothetical protein
VLARGDRPGHRVLAGAGDLGVEVDLDTGVAEHLVQAGGPAGQAVPLGDGAQLVFAPADQHRLRVEHGPVADGQATLLPDGQQRPDQVLPVPHPAGDAVNRYLHDLARHGAAFRVR